MPHPQSLPLFDLTWSSMGKFYSQSIVDDNDDRHYLRKVNTEAFKAVMPAKARKKPAKHVKGRSGESDLVHSGL